MGGFGGGCGIGVAAFLLFACLARGLKVLNATRAHFPPVGGLVPGILPQDFIGSVMPFWFSRKFMAG